MLGDLRGSQNYRFPASVDVPADSSATSVSFDRLVGCPKNPNHLPAPFGRDARRKVPDASFRSCSIRGGERHMTRDDDAAFTALGLFLRRR